MANYPYIILPGKTGPVYKPIIPVILNFKRTHKITSPIYALIDSGADVCFCAKDIGLWLGIKFTKKKRHAFTTANRTTFKAIREDLVLHTAGKKLICPFFFTNTLPEETPIILGQKGFFENFTVTFDLRNKTIEID